MNRKIRTYGIILLNACIAVCAFIGGLDHYIYGDFTVFFLISVHSDFWAMSLSIVMIVFEIRRLINKKPLPKFIQTVKLTQISFTVLTCVLFIIFQLPTVADRMTVKYLYSLANLCSHFILPVLLTLDLLLFADFRDTKKQNVFFSLIPYFVYVASLVIAALCNVKFLAVGNSSPRIVPYPIIDPTVNGWFTLGGGKVGVFYIIVGATLLFAAFGFIVRFVGNFLRNRERNAVDGSTGVRNKG